MEALAHHHTKIHNRSNVASVTYHPQDAALDVEFNGGGTYRYHGVPPETHAAMLTAPSAGKFVATELKPNHRATRV